MYTLACITEKEIEGNKGDEFYIGVEKIRSVTLAACKVKISGSEKESEQEHK